ncbi:zinc-dependent alcohol dehydrogenase family protein [candidate division WOR-3 bacterium]|nr:zinc-dependent alcohol dehydrogenase family protein [candidate division WOR-3 bacterium]
MKAMVLNKTCDLGDVAKPLEMVDMPIPLPKKGEILVRISVCGVCHTELDEIEARTPPTLLPIILGHQIVGRVEKRGEGTVRFKTGDRVGIAWIYSTCGRCRYCLSGNENLCDNFRATGRDVNGGYAEYITISEQFAYKIPKIFSDTEAAPLLCAGAIGYRSLRLTGLKDGEKLGLYGFGASAHLVIKMVRYIYPNSRIFVFVRSKTEREFARELGAFSVGDIGDSSPEKLDCIIDTTPVWQPMVRALKNLRSGGRLVINAIRKENIDKDHLLRLDYSTHLWLEKEIKTVANVERRDVSQFLDLAAQIPIKPDIEAFPLKEANKALLEIKEGKIHGAKVLKVVPTL